MKCISVSFSLRYKALSRISPSVLRSALGVDSTGWSFSVSNSIFNHFISFVGFLSFGEARVCFPNGLGRVCSPWNKTLRRPDPIVVFILQYSVSFLYMFNLIVYIYRFTQRRQVHKERRPLVKFLQLYTWWFVPFRIMHWSFSFVRNKGSL